jgi:hypothetical protein
MNSHFKFPRRVRIHGGECGAVARALHHEVQKFALTQNEQSLISDEKAFLRQADSGKALESTFIERKSMTKRNLRKRLALTVVAALSAAGLGTLSAPVANAAQSSLLNSTYVVGTSLVTDIAVTTDLAPVAGVLGDRVQHTVYWKTQTTVTAASANPNVVLVSYPTGGGLTYENADGDVASGVYSFATTTLGSTRADDNAESLSQTSTAVNGAYAFGDSFLYAHYPVAGTYKWTLWDDLNADDIVNNGEYAESFTVVVGSGDQALTITMAAHNATSGAGSIYGSLVKVTSVDASGNPAAPSTAGGVSITASGSAQVTMVNGADVTAPAATYTLTAADFNGSGNAWVNIEDATAESVTLSVSGSGANAATGTAIVLSFVATAGTSTASPVKISTGSNVGGSTNTAYTAPDTTKTLSFKTGSVSTAKDDVNVIDTSGKITGKAGTEYSLAVAGSDTSGAANPGSFSISFPATAASQSFQMNTNAGAANTVVTSAVRAATTVTVVTSGGYTDSIRAAAASTITFQVNVDDQFGANMADVTVTPSITGRNASLTMTNKVTDSSGNILFSYTDAGTLGNDTITFTANGTSDTATVTFTSAADLGASTVLLTTAQTDATGAILSTYDNFGINAGDGVQAGAITVTATVKDGNAAVLAGVPVTFTVAGTGVAITSTTSVTRYTASDGTATASVFAWIAGSYVVTATTGTKSDTVTTYWAQETGTNTREISASASGRVITATAKDRLGNVVKGADVSARITSGDCFFGTGTNIASGSTASDGTVKFLLGEGPACTVDVQAGASGGSSTYGQTDALKGTVSTNDPEDTFTATTVGTATTAAVGVGASFDAAGVNKVTVTVAAGQATKDAADAATDAAAEAIDAANAATDAANLAAEAADAATVAAEEARDAADAATAAVEELATQVATLMAALKAQITTLANTVAKIAKKVKA